MTITEQPLIVGLLPSLGTKPGLILGQRHQSSPRLHCKFEVTPELTIASNFSQKSHFFKNLTTGENNNKDDSSFTGEEIDQEQWSYNNKKRTLL